MIPAAWLRRRWRMMPDRVTTSIRAQTALGMYDGGTAVPDSWWRSNSGGTVEADPSFGVYTAGRRTWFVPKERYAAVPAVGDLLVSPISPIDPVAYTWTILGVDHVGALGTWSLETISLALAAALRGTVTVARPDNTRDAAGRMALTAYTAVATAVPARVQPTDNAAADVLERRTMPNSSTCYLGYAVDVRAKDLVTDNLGNKYTVLASRLPSRLDELQVLDLEQVL